MNAGFEDCTALNHLLDKYEHDISRCLQEYSRTRVKSTYAISDLAMYNYLEMRDLCSRKTFRIRQLIDNLLFKFFPSKWIPLYVSVTYSSMNYEKCLENKKWQCDVSINRYICYFSIFEYIICLQCPHCKEQKYFEKTIFSFIKFFRRICPCSF